MFFFFFKKEKEKYDIRQKKASWHAQNACDETSILIKY